MFTHSAHWILLCWAGRNFTLKRDSFIFYRSFYEAINELSVNEKAILFDAICSYSLDFKEPELSGICKTVFILIKPQLDANNKRFENGSKPKNKQTGSKQEAKPKQKVSKAEANNNENVNNNVNDKIDFSVFWNLYPVKKGKAKCEPKWNKLTEQEKQSAIQTLPTFIANKPFPNYTHPFPETYLNQKRWDDELVSEPTLTEEQIKKQREADFLSRL